MPHDYSPSRVRWGTPTFPVWAGWPEGAITGGGGGGRGGFLPPPYAFSLSWWTSSNTLRLILLINLTSNP